MDTMGAVLLPLLQHALVNGDLETVRRSLEAVVKEGTLYRAELLGSNGAVIVTTPVDELIVSHK